MKMGEPFFKARERLAAMGARVFSSNYTLYGDMSRRVMDTLHTVVRNVLPSSIDEAFLVLPTGPPTRAGPTPRRSGSGWARSRTRRGPRAPVDRDPRPRLRRRDDDAREGGLGVRPGPDEGR